VWLHDLDDDDILDLGATPSDSPYIPLEDAAEPGHTRVLCAIRSACGVAQGCPAATFGAVLPQHLTLHTIQKEFPALNIMWADDSYYSDPVDIIYDAFARGGFGPPKLSIFLLAKCSRERLSSCALPA
jgi:hypothetical protein